jgi:hypothetical protein
MKITIFSLRDDFARLRLNFIMIAFFTIFLSLFGMFDLYNHEYISIDNLQMYSIFGLIIGIIILLISCLKKKETIDYYSLYSD